MTIILRSSRRETPHDLACSPCATDEREVVRHYTLNGDDLDVIVRKRLDATGSASRSRSA
jgi:hypothetical protein